MHKLLAEKVLKHDNNSNSLGRLRKAMQTMSANLPDGVRECRMGLNAFAQYSLASLSAHIKKVAATLATEAQSSDAPSVQFQSFTGSSHFAMSQQRLASGSSLFKQTLSGEVIQNLNDRIQSLSTVWEKRRMEERLREQDRISGNVANVEQPKVEVEIKRYLYRSGK